MCLERGDEIRDPVDDEVNNLWKSPQVEKISGRKLFCVIDIMMQFMSVK